MALKCLPDYYYSMNYYSMHNLCCLLWFDYYLTSWNFLIFPIFLITLFIHCIANVLCFLRCSLWQNLIYSAYLINCTLPTDWPNENGIPFYANFQKTAWMRIITIDTILQKFAYPCARRYADFIGLSGEPHLKVYSSSLSMYTLDWLHQVW